MRPGLTPAEVVDRAFPPEQSNPSYGESPYWPMYGPHNWRPGGAGERDACSPPLEHGYHGPYML